MNEVEFEAIEGELALYEKGRQLRVVVNTPAWETVVQTLEDYRDKAFRALIGLDPGDSNVPTAHAAAAALDDLVSKFQQDINQAIAFAANPSEEVKHFLHGTLQSLDVQRAMEQRQ